MKIAIKNAWPTTTKRKKFINIAYHSWEPTSEQPTVRQQIAFRINSVSSKGSLMSWLEFWAQRLTQCTDIYALFGILRASILWIIESKAKAAYSSHFSCCPRWPRILWTPFKKKSLSSELKLRCSFCSNNWEQTKLSPGACWNAICNLLEPADELVLSILFH